MRRLAPGLAAVVAVTAGVIWWSRPSPPVLPPAGALEGANVLLVTVDTLRADRLGAYGARHPTPALDALAASGAMFSRAYTHAVMTLPAHASLLTGLVPPRHGVRTNGVARLPRAIDTLPERFQSMGYRTGAFVAAFVLDRRYGLDQGFETYDDRLRPGPGGFAVAERPATSVLSAALTWLRKPGGGPWLCWVHLFEPHTPYVAPARSGDPYTDEVLAVDQELGGFLAALRAEGLLDRTLVVLTSDHGESLGEHGEATHGLFAYEATLRVPLIMAGPGIPPGTIETPVSHVEVAATMLSLAGARAEGLDGAPLHGGGSQPEQGQPAIYFEAMDANVTRGWAPLSGVVRGDWKYIDLPLPELYDVASDPGELRNLAASEPALRARLAGDAADWRRGAAAGPERAEMDADAAARLRSLGYAAGGTAPLRDAFTAADDPKTLLPLHDRLMRALDLADRGDDAGALAEFRALIDSRADFTAAYTAAASLMIGRGDAAAAVKLLERARTSGAASAEVDERLAAALIASGEPRRAVQLLRSVLEERPDYADAWNALAVAYLATGQTGEARQALTRALAAAPSAAGMWTNLGLLELEARRYAEAAAAFRRSTELDAEAVDAWRGLGAAALQQNDPAAAIASWTRAIALQPDDPATLFNLGVLLADAAPERAQPYLERFLRLPGTSPADRAHVQALITRGAGTKKTPEAPRDPRR